MQFADLIIYTPFFNKNNIKLSLKGCFIKWNSNIYILTVHHNLPINNVLLNDNNLDIIINSKWSEVLILDGNNYYKDFIVLNKIQNKLPKINNIINMEKYLLKVIDYEFINFDNYEGPQIPYIKCELLNPNIDFNILKGLSGIPVFLKNKLIGIFTHFKYITCEFFVYILPMYIYTKNLKKTNEIYTFNDTNINKINNYKVKTSSNMKIIYHNILNIYVPLTTYFLLELDINNTLINIKDNNYVLIKSFNKNEKLKLQITNEPNLIIDNNEYKINLRLLSLMRQMNFDGLQILYLINLVIKNENIKLLIINNKIKIHYHYQF
jgi:hypothetical protein